MTAPRPRPGARRGPFGTAFRLAPLGLAFRPAPLRTAVLPALVGLASACGGSGKGDGGVAARDTLTSRPEPAPAAADSPGVQDDQVGSCVTDRLDPGRLDLAAAWQGGHLHVAGRVPGGAGKTLVLSLSYRAKFVFDEVFRDKRLAAIDLASDSVDVRSVSYAPTPSEQAAFARRGALALAAAAEPCLDVALYEKLDLLASRHIALPPPH